MYNNQMSSPYAPAPPNHNNPGHHHQNTGRPGPMRPRQAPRNTASKAYVKTVAQSSQHNEYRLDVVCERLDYIEAFLSKKFNPQYEPHAIFRARENLTFATTESAPWATPNPLESPIWSNPINEFVQDRGCGDMTPRTSKADSQEKGLDLTDMAEQIREVKGLVMKIMDTKPTE